MKTRTVLIMGLVGLLVPRVYLFAADPTPATAEEELTKLEQDWGDCYVKRDPSFAQRITAEDFAFVGPDGNMVGKPEYVKSIDGPTVFTAFNIEKLKVRVYGDAAVVVGVVAISAKTGSKDESGKYAFTDTFVKQNGEWKAVSGQATAIAKP